MKKILSAMLVVILCIGTTASAMMMSATALVGSSTAVNSTSLSTSLKDTAYSKILEEYKIPSKTVTSGDVTITLSGAFNKTPNEKLELDEMVKFLNESKFVCNVKFECDEDGKTMKLKFSCEYFDAWLSYDATNASDKKLMIVGKSPEEPGYVFINFDDLGSLKKILLNTSSAEELALKDAEVIVSKLLGKINFTQNGKTYKIGIEEAAIKDIARYVYSVDRLKSQYNSPIYKLMNMDEEMAEEQVVFVSAMLTEYLDKLDAIKLFAKDAVAVEVTLDNNDNISKLTYSINIQTNAYDVAVAFGADKEDIPAAKEECDIDLTLKVDMEFSNVNQNVNLTMPALYESNSVNVLEMMRDTVNVVVDGRMVNFDKYSLWLDEAPYYISAYPVDEDWRILVPIRAISDSFSAQTTWDGNSGTATITRGNRTITLTKDQKTAYVNGVAVELDVPARIINERLFVPVRFVAEAFQAEVEWLSVPNIVVITSK